MNYTHMSISQMTSAQSDLAQSDLNQIDLNQIDLNKTDLVQSDPIHFVHHLTEEEENDLNYDYEFNKRRTWNWSSVNHKPPFDTDYGEMDIDEADEVMRVAIGRKGCYLCRITEANNIAYISHDRERKKMVIWGEHFKMDTVKNEIASRINIAREQLMSV